jgi:hypothetical protein
MPARENSLEVSDAPPLREIKIVASATGEPQKDPSTSEEATHTCCPREPTSIGFESN